MYKGKKCLGGIMNSTLDRKMVHRKRLNSNNYRREVTEENNNYIVAQIIICGMIILGVFIIKLVGIEATDKMVDSLSLAISSSNLTEMKEFTQTVLESNKVEDNSDLLLPLELNSEDSQEAMQVFNETEIFIHSDFAINEQLQEELEKSRGEEEEKK